MLVLGRMKDEMIVIGGNIEVTVVDIRGDKVRLGINAPKSISVHRKEVQRAIDAEGRESGFLNKNGATEAIVRLCAVAQSQLCNGGDVDQIHQQLLEDLANVC